MSSRPRWPSDGIDMKHAAAWATAGSGCASDRPRVALAEGSVSGRGQSSRSDISSNRVSFNTTSRPVKLTLKGLGSWNRSSRTLPDQWPPDWSLTRIDQ